MSIEFGPRIECSICHVPKQQSNHWFRVWFERNIVGERIYRKEERGFVKIAGIVITELLPGAIQGEQDLITGEEHACGDSCLGKLIGRMVAKEFPGLAKEVSSDAG